MYQSAKMENIHSIHVKNTTESKISTFRPRLKHHPLIDYFQTSRHVAVRHRDVNTRYNRTFVARCFFNSNHERLKQLVVHSEHAHSRQNLDN